MIHSNPRRRPMPYPHIAPSAHPILRSVGVASERIPRYCSLSSTKTIFRRDTTRTMGPKKNSQSLLPSPHPTSFIWPRIYRHAPFPTLRGIFYLFYSGKTQEERVGVGVGRATTRRRHSSTATVQARTAEVRREGPPTCREGRMPIKPLARNRRRGEFLGWGDSLGEAARGKFQCHTLGTSEIPRCTHGKRCTHGNICFAASEVSTV